MKTDQAGPIHVGAKDISPEEWLKCAEVYEELARRAATQTMEAKYREWARECREYAKEASDG